MSTDEQEELSNHKKKKKMIFKEGIIRENKKMPYTQKMKGLRRNEDAMKY